MVKAKWLIYTVLVGLLPFFSRAIIFLLTKHNLGYDFLFNEIDFIFFALILNITNINELEDKFLDERRWRTLAIGFSLIFIILTAVLFSISCINSIWKDLFNIRSIKISAVFASAFSFLFSYSIYYKISKTEQIKVM